MNDLLGFVTFESVLDFQLLAGVTKR